MIVAMLLPSLDILREKGPSPAGIDLLKADVMLLAQKMGWIVET